MTDRFTQAIQSGRPDNMALLQDLIIQATEAGEVEFTMVPLVTSLAGRTATFWVFQDALKIDGIRVNVTAETQQNVADLLGCMLLTPKMLDLMYVSRSCSIEPKLQPINSTVGGMVQHSRKIDEDLSSLTIPEMGMIGTVGKQWVLDNDLLVKAGRAENYGWHFEGPNFKGLAGEAVASLMKDRTGQYRRLIQGRGWHHDVKHVDYSQTCLLVSERCEIDGSVMNLADVLRDPTLAGLASHQGPLKVLRQPGVPFLLPTLHLESDDGVSEPIS